MIIEHIGTNRKTMSKVPTHIASFIGLDLFRIEIRGAATRYNWRRRKWGRQGCDGTRIEKRLSKGWRSVRDGDAKTKGMVGSRLVQESGAGTDRGVDKRIEIVPRSRHEGQGLRGLPLILDIEPQPVLVVRLGG